MPRFFVSMTTPDVTTEANYGARAGQKIAGRLVRGKDGRFSSDDGGSGSAASGKKGKAGSARPSVKALPKVGKPAAGKTMGKFTPSKKKPPKPKKAKASKPKPEETIKQFDDNEVQKLLDYGAASNQDKGNFDFGDELKQKLLQSGIMELGVDGKPALTAAGRDLIVYVRNQPYQQQEANQRNSTADLMLIQQLHDTAVALGASCGNASPTPSPMSTLEAVRVLEAAKRNSAADQNRIQNVHDLAMMLGADCGGSYEAGRPFAEAKFSMASTQIDLPELREFLFPKSNGDLQPSYAVDKADLHEYGLETDTHVTVFYGVNPDTYEQVVAATRGFGPFEIELSGVSLFENPDFDVLKIDVRSPELRRLHRSIQSNVPHNNQRSMYHPHITIAYLLPGRGEQYIRWYSELLKGRRYKVDSIQFSGTNGQKRSISLFPKTDKSLIQQFAEAWRGASPKGKRCYSKLVGKYGQQKAIAICRASLKEEADEIDFTPPKDVQQAALRGLALRKKYGRGGLSTNQAGKQGIGSGVARAVSLSKGQAQSPDTIRQMVRFFARHERNKNTPPEEGNGRIAWLLWGGDAGQRWATSVLSSMNAADTGGKESL